MKRRIIIALTVICLVATAMTAVISAAAAEEENTLDPVTLEQLDYTDSFFYDQISERQQMLYSWLKDYYDTFDGEPGRYEYDITDMLPESFTGEDCDALLSDILVADKALKSDDPLYELKGEIDGSGSDIDYQHPYGTFMRLYIVHMDIRTPDLEARAAARIEQIVNTIGEGDRYTKLYKLSHYILTEAFYDPYHVVMNSSAERTRALESKGFWYNAMAYGLLAENIAVCDGFADTVKVLCNALDIPCLIIGNEGHAWNMVQMEDGSWYHFDLTRERAGWDKYNDLENFYMNYFLRIEQWEDRHNPPYYTIGVNNVHYATDFPEESDHHYVYTGPTTDFSYTVAPSTYVPGEPTFVYTVNADKKTCTIVNYEGKEEGDLVIPETIDGYTVTAIAPFAFYYCTDFDGKLVIPSTVATIGEGAFTACYNLTSIEFSMGLEEIGRCAFAGCKGISEVILPDSVVKIDEYAFYDCDKLTSITFGGHVQSVGEDILGLIDGSVTVKAPAGSDAERYATEKGIAFEICGENCSFVDVDGAWDGDGRGHFHVCEHGVKFDIEKHSCQEINCGDECGVCGIRYCRTYGFSMDVEMELVGARPATCISAEYTGDLVCSCGAGGRPGEYVGGPNDNHTPEDRWMPISPTEHYQKCRDCGTVVARSEHTGGTATYTEKAKCEVCDQEYGKIIPHEHTGGTATETEFARCEKCGMAYGNLLPASPKGEEKPSEKVPFDTTFIIIGAAALVVLLAVTCIVIVINKRKSRKAE